ncbi:MAG TPA: hypothetical protein VEU47_12875 [Candidatus Cybelea sp.]|nr:hypothetical protein [Candidatus Cybelea sp.]
MELEQLIPVELQDVERDIAIAIAVIDPPVQFGRGRMLPGQQDEQRRMAARLIAERLMLMGFRWFRKPPAKRHSTP